MAPVVLSPEGRQQRRLASAFVEDALSVIAADAIGILSGEREGRLSLCASPTCRAAFFDASRGATSEWCEMNDCRNRQKKARFLANRRQTSHSGDWAPSRTHHGFGDDKPTAGEHSCAEVAARLRREGPMTATELGLPP